MATVTALVGVVVMPLGLAAARLLWGEVAHSIGVRGGLAVPSSVALVVLGAGAGERCARAALGVGQDDPAQQLRSGEATVASRPHLSESDPDSSSLCR
jgi:hypothetical protein